MTKLAISPVFEPEQVLHDAQVEDKYDNDDNDEVLMTSYCLWCYEFLPYISGKVHKRCPHFNASPPPPDPAERTLICSRTSLPATLPS